MTNTIFYCHTIFLRLLKKFFFFGFKMVFLFYTVDKLKQGLRMQQKNMQENIVCVMRIEKNALLHK